MLTYDISKCNNKPIYEFLYCCIKNDILNGVLHSQEKLPSKRSFAKNLGISVITVEACYGLLVDEGYIFSVNRVGFFVSKIKRLKGNLSSANKTTKNTLPNEKNKSDFSKKQIAPKIDLTTSQNCHGDFPFSVWAKIMRKTISQNQEKLMQNTSIFGTLELRQSIARYIREFRGMNVSENQIIIGAGTEYLYGLLIQVLGFKKNYGVENPGYKKLFSIYKNYGVNYIPIPLDEKGVKISELKKSKVQIMHVTPSHQFPTGYILSANRRIELLNWAYEKKNRYIIEDDYDSEFRFNGNPISSLQNMDKYNRVIYINTFSKTLSSTIRISYIILPESLISKFQKALGFYSCTVPSFEQLTLAQFINEGYFERHINRMRKINIEKRNKFIQAIKKFDTNKTISILKGNAGLHFLIKIAPVRSAKKIQEQLAKKNIKISLLDEYYIKNNSTTEKRLPFNTRKPIENAIFVVNYTSLKSEQIEHVAKILCNAITTIVKPSRLFRRQL